MNCACPALNRRPHLISVSGARFQTDAVMVCIIIIAGTGVAMTQLLQTIEKRSARWPPKYRRIIPNPPASPQSPGANNPLVLRPACLQDKAQQ